MALFASTGAGVKLQRGDGASPEVFTTILEEVSIANFGALSQLVEATHLLSAAKEFLYGLAEGSEMTLTCNFLVTDTTQANMIADQTNKVTRNFKLVFPTSPNKTFSFAALVLGWNLPSIVPNEPVHVTFTLKISGAIPPAS